MFPGHDRCMTNQAATQDPVLVAFGRQVRTARERSGRRIVDVIEDLEISRSHYDSIEAGRVRASNVMYWRIADYLKIDPTPVLREAS